MTNTIPSGLGATLGFVAEATVGTAVTVSRWIPFDKETLQLHKTTVQSQGLHQGLYEQTNRRAYVAHWADGQIDMDVVDRQLGLILKNMLGTGTAVTQVGLTGAYLATYYPADKTGVSMTIQKGVPETITGPGTLQAFTYNGCKIKDWTLSVQRDQLAKLSFTVDSWNESTSVSYAAPSFVAGNVLAFHQGAITLGGTVNTSANVTTISSGVVPTGVVSGVTIKHVDAFDDRRFTIGSATKKEQYANGFRKITGTLDMEFSTLADAYTAFSSTATPPVEVNTALEFDLTGNVIGGGNSAFLKCVIPYLYFDTVPVVIQGPQVVTVKATWTALDNGVDNPIQLQYQSADVSL